MPATSLHTAVSQIAINKTALVLGPLALRNAVLTTFQKSITQMLNASVPSLLQNVEVQFTAISVNPRAFTADLSRSMNNRIGVDIRPDFVITLSVHVAGDATLKFSSVTFSVSGVRFNFRADGPILKLEQPTFDVLGQETDVPTRQHALTQSGVAEPDLMRFEGALTYYMPARIVASALGLMKPIDLSEVFRGFELKGAMNLDIANANSETYLVIVPGDGGWISEATCPLVNGAPDLNIIATPGGTGTWTMNPSGVPAPTVPRVFSQDSRLASVYLPKPILDERFGKVQPGFVYRDSDNGFLGYDLHVDASLTFISLSIDEPRLSLLADFGIQVNGEIFVTVDVPCVGRVDVGYARVDVDPSHVQLRLFFAMNSAKQLVLMCQIEQLQMGNAHANVSVVSQWLGMAGGRAAVIGFILDYVLKRVIEHNAPGFLADVIRKQLNSNSMILADLADIFKYITSYHDGGTFSGEPTSILVGATYDIG